MDIDMIAKELTERIVKFENKKKITWREVFEKELDSVKGLKGTDRDLVLVRIVREISKRGYIIQDDPFKLIR